MEQTAAGLLSVKSNDVAPIFADGYAKMAYGCLNDYHLFNEQEPEHEN
jgi:hypothetical protein